MISITPDDIDIGRPLTDPERATARLRIDTLIEQLESWCRQKFNSVVITDERHFTSNPGNIFLRWGEPTGPVQVKFSSLGATPITYDGDSWRSGIYNRSQGMSSFPVYVTYTPDTTEIEHYMNSIKSIVITAVSQYLMLPLQARYKVMSGYTVEGLSITFGNSSETTFAGTRYGDLGTVISLAPISGLKRRLVI